MPNYVCVCVPEFPLQALLRLRVDQRDRPVAVLDGERPFEVVCSTNAKAAKLGIKAGMTRAEAEMCAIHLLQRSHAEELVARAALFSGLSVFTPRLEDVSDDKACIVVLDLAGTEKLLGQLVVVVERIVSGLELLGLFPRVATGSNFHGVVCLARSGGKRIVHVTHGEESNAIAHLPLSALEMRPRHLESLSQWGLKNLGDLAALPLEALIARLGQEGKRLRELARSEHPHLFQPIEQPLVFEEYMEFDTPVEQKQSLLFTLTAMVDQLVCRTKEHALAIAGMTLCCGLEGGGHDIRSIRSALPTENRIVLIKLLQFDFEAHPLTAGVLTLRLTGGIGPVSKVQAGLFSPPLPEPACLEVTMARIAAIVGEGRAGKATLRDTHVSDAFAIAKFTVEAAHRSSSSEKADQLNPALRRFRPVLFVRVEFEAQHLAALWFEATRYKIQRLYGPWQANGGWWNQRAWAKERWDFAACSATGVLLAGVILHNKLLGTWHLEGIYD